ncbi:hypothetical protein ATEIFO6365_0015020300 [Aspergillus terreus]|uniref:Uncharacterized protein n=1 Tax=Aspergillus terreus TaxID=33178 RepID=A0A5M3ZDG5_ASPTE|nr:hypothetical protein ATETN484_0016020200 [Aspergillus terreus]GFF21631.1 hypothetical protein ATEIFO6365_0015020300 [Aspergillus terreus]
MNCLTTFLSYIFPRHSPPTTHTSDTHPYKPFPEDNSPEKADPPIPLLSLLHPRPKKHKRVRFGPTADIPNRRLSSSSASSLDTNDSNIILPHRRNIRRRSIMKQPTALDQEMVFWNTCRMVAVAEQRLEMSYHYIMRGGGDLEAVLVEEEYIAEGGWAAAEVEEEAGSSEDVIVLW